jgi:hypothetical protein
LEIKEKIKQVKYLACNEDFETKISYLWQSRFVYVLVYVITKLLADFQLLRMWLREIFIVTQTLIETRRSQQMFVREWIGKICNEEFIVECTLELVTLFL